MLPQSAGQVHSFSKFGLSRKQHPSPHNDTQSLVQLHAFSAPLQHPSPQVKLSAYWQPVAGSQESDVQASPSSHAPLSGA